MAMMKIDFFEFMKLSNKIKKEKLCNIPAVAVAPPVVLGQFSPGFETEI